MSEHPAQDPVERPEPRPETEPRTSEELDVEGPNESAPGSNPPVEEEPEARP
ncbi:MAG: hypothetical protein M3N16_07555 [Actinomycetota bacterium]|nr:hypothetical protein [Actinomycetota bacterium]